MREAAPHKSHKRGRQVSTATSAPGPLTRATQAAQGAPLISTGPQHLSKCTCTPDKGDRSSAGRTVHERRAPALHNGIGSKRLPRLGRGLTQWAHEDAAASQTRSRSITCSNSRQGIKALRMRRAGMALFCPHFLGLVS